MRADNEQELEQQAQDERDRLKLRGVQMDGHVISSFRDRDPAAFRSCFHSPPGRTLVFGLGLDERSRLPDWWHARWSAHTRTLTLTHALAGTLCAIMSWRRLGAGGGWRLAAQS